MDAKLYKDELATRRSQQRSTERTARHYMLLSLGAALGTIGLKLVAYRLTGSVGLLSDAAESVVNLAAALIAIWALTLADRPPDADHAYGHSKVEKWAHPLQQHPLTLGIGRQIVSQGCDSATPRLHLRSYSSLVTA